MRLPISGRELLAGSAPCARSSGRRCSAAHRAGRAPGRRRSGRRRGSARQVPQWSRLRRIGRQLQRGVDLAEEQPGADARARPGWCACPASPARPARASGFSITGAVSTKTFTSAPKRCAIQRRQRLQPALDHVMVVAALGIDADGAAVGAAPASPAGPRPARRRGRARSTLTRLRPQRLRGCAALRRRARPASPCRRAWPAARKPVQPRARLAGQQRLGEAHRIEAERAAPRPGSVAAAQPRPR